MANTHFQFKKFIIHQDKTAMKVGVDSVLLGAVAGFSNPHNILDIGAGTGLLSFMAEQRTGALVTAVEYDYDAFIQCSENVELNKKSGNIIVIHSSIQNYTRNSKEFFDHIISNPPFFNNTYKSEIQSRNLARNNEKLTFSELLNCVSELLSDTGIFSVIIPYSTQESFIRKAEDFKLFCVKEIKVFPNEIKKANRVILEFVRDRENAIFEEIIVRDSKTNKYTEKYKKITEEFYLKI
jgi:tRNA1Val (adenine37-N6)-methyltransferase